MATAHSSFSRTYVLPIRVLATIGFSISAYLFIQKISGNISSVVGCGGEGGCANVLGSKWSQWMNIPVSGLATILYLAIIALTFKPTRIALNTFALVLIGAAIWFLVLMTLVIDSFCPWCFATHATGILTAISILVATRRTQLVTWLQSCYFALVPLVILIGGQIWGPEPDTHVIVEGSNSNTQNLPIHQRGNGREISFGYKDFNIGELPIIGSPDAKHILVKYYDYTCSSCLDMEKDLDLLLEKHPKKFAVILLPTPLNRACNPHMKREVRDHPQACELAKLSLAAWRAQPESFSEVHKLLFSRPILSEADATRKITEFIPQEKLDAALKDPWVDELIAANIFDYQQLCYKQIAMPKLRVVDKKELHGLARTTEIFIEQIEKVFGY